MSIRSRAAIAVVVVAVLGDSVGNVVQAEMEADGLLA